MPPSLITFRASARKSATSIVLAADCKVDRCYCQFANLYLCGVARSRRILVVTHFRNPDRWCRMKWDC